MRRDARCAAAVEEQLNESQGLQVAVNQLKRNHQQLQQL